MAVTGLPAIIADADKPCSMLATHLAQELELAGFMVEPAARESSPVTFAVRCGDRRLIVGVLDGNG